MDHVTAGGLLHSVRASTATVLAELDRWAPADADLTVQSLLPGWSRGHVLSHLARGSDALAATMAGTLRGELVPLYPNGDDDRARDIEAGAGQPAARILADVHAATERLDRVFSAVRDAESWDRVADRGLSNAELLVSRWCEVEVHRVDVGLAAPAQWPTGFVARLLPEAIAGLADRIREPVQLEISGDAVTTVEPATGDGAHLVIVRGEPAEVLAWLLGREAALDRPFPALPRAPWRRVPLDLPSD
jgi:maleylpyruvate isomerase